MARPKKEDTTKVTTKKAAVAAKTTTTTPVQTIETKAAEVKEDTTKEATVKKEVKKTPAKKTAAKKTTKTATKATAKKAEPKTTAKAANKQALYVEYAGHQVSQEDIMSKVKADLEAKGAKAAALKVLDVYAQPENNVVYYVSNAGTAKEIKGEVSFF